MAFKAVAPRRKQSHVQIVDKVRLGGIDRAAIDEWAGFRTHTKSTIETRLSDNLLRAVLFVFRGFGIREQRARERGGEFTPPTEAEVYEKIMSDRLVRQRMRELVAQANLTGMTWVPVKLPDNPDAPACGFITHVLANLSDGFDEENRPNKVPTLTPRFIGAAPRSEHAPVEHVMVEDQSAAA